MFTRRFLIYSSIAFVLTAVLVTILYLYCDRSVVTWANKENLNRFIFFKGITYIATMIRLLSVFTLVSLTFVRMWRQLTPLMVVLLVASLSTIIGEAIVEALKTLFGRYWPATWVNQNPAFLSDGAYGFHFFRLGVDYGSFPSGHSAVVFGAMTVIWVKFPKWIPLCLAAEALEIIGLVAMNYHFLSDIAGGAFIGIMTALFALRSVKFDSARLYQTL